MKAQYLESIYQPVESKTFRSALINFLLREFPQMGGPMIMELFADRMEKMIERFYPPVKHLKMGQILWFAVEKNEKPSYGKSMKQTRIVPVVLTLVSLQDIEKLKNKARFATIKTEIMARLYREADQQGATLSETDVSLMLMLSLQTISKNTLKYEKEHNTTLPRRGTVHDMGRSMSHKATICRKRKIERKSTSLVAQETNHSPNAVDRYTLDLDRVGFCLEKKLSVEEASFVTGLSKNLVLEYRKLSDEIKGTPPCSYGGIDLDDIPF
jgi:hypothetical protein